MQHFIYILILCFFAAVLLSAAGSLLLRRSRRVRAFRIGLTITGAACVVASLFQWWRWDAMVHSASYEAPLGTGFGVVAIILFPWLGAIASGAALGALWMERRFAAAEADG